MSERILRRLAIFVVAGLCCASPKIDAASEVAAGPSVEDRACRAVEAFHGTLLEVMQSGLDYRGRYEKLSPAVRAAFDMRTIARLSLGSKQWRALEASDQKRFLDTLFDLVVATYAARFKSYAGQVFESLSVESPRKGQVVVKTQLVRKKGDPVPLDYYLRSSDDPPRIFNIVADGVSDLSIRRADYSAIIRKDGFEGLLASLAQDIIEYQQDDEEG